MTSTQTNKRQIFSYPLASQRYNFVKEFLEGQPEVKRLVDFGSGNGRMCCWVKQVNHLQEILFVDKDNPLLEDTLHYNFKPNLLEALFGRSKSRLDLTIQVWNADMTKPSDLFLNTDCITLVEVIEHLEPDDVDKAVRTIFGYYQPKFVIITTPNCEFNHLLRDSSTQSKESNGFRHYDHKFEWNRLQFRNFSEEICKRFPYYTFKLDGVGHLPGLSEPFGPCTQIAIYTRLTNECIPMKRQDIDLDILFDNLATKDPEKGWGYHKVQNNPMHKAEFLIPGKKGGPTPYDNISWSDLDDPVIAAKFSKDLDEYERENKIGIYSPDYIKDMEDNQECDGDEMMDADDHVWATTEPPEWHKLDTPIFPTSDA